MHNTAQNKIIKKPAQQNGGNSLGRKKRESKHADSKGAAYDSSFCESELHVLIKGLAPLPLWQVKLMRGTKKDEVYENDALAILDTHSKQLQAISDLWAIVKAQPKYKQLKDPVLKKETEPKTVLHYIFRKLGPLAKGLDWNIDTYSEGRKTRYCFVVKKFYPNYQVRHHDLFLALDFLPALEKKDKQLHDMIIEVVAFVSREAKVPLWDEDGDYSKASEYLWSNVDKEYSSSRIMANFDAYTWGTPFEYLNKIKARREKATYKSILRISEGYNAKSDRQQILVRWLRAGIELAKQKDCIENHTYIPVFDTDRKKCIAPYRNYKLIWSCHSNDLLNVHASKCWQEDNSKYGQYWPTAFCITKPGQKVEPIKVSKFPIKLDAFLGLGDYYFTRKYEQYFYKNKLNEPHSPWES